MLCLKASKSLKCFVNLGKMGKCEICCNCKEDLFLKYAVFEKKKCAVNKEDYDL